MPTVNQANVDRFSGFADVYDAHRPTPPLAVVDLLTQLIQNPRPACVVDIGCGTGLSTRLWAGRADQVLGLDPNPDMLAQARARTASLDPAGTVFSFRQATSTDTGLPDASADIVTVSQALHWMDPEPTFAEIARILRPQGLFVAYDCDWPPAITADLHAAYIAFEDRVDDLERRHGCSPQVLKHNKSGHLDRMRDSGHFRHCFEALLHSVETGSAERLVQLARSQGSVQACLRAGLSEDAIGLSDLRAAALRVLKSKHSIPWLFSYRLRIGIK